MAEKQKRTPSGVSSPSIGRLNKPRNTSTPPSKAKKIKKGRRIERNTEDTTYTPQKNSTDNPPSADKAPTAIVQRKWVDIAASRNDNDDTLQKQEMSMDNSDNTSGNDDEENFIATSDGTGTLLHTPTRLNPIKTNLNAGWSNTEADEYGSHNKLSSPEAGPPEDNWAEELARIDTSELENKEEAAEPQLSTQWEEDSITDLDERPQNNDADEESTDSSGRFPDADPIDEDEETEQHEMQLGFRHDTEDKEKNDNEDDKDRMDTTPTASPEKPQAVITEEKTSEPENTSSNEEEENQEDAKDHMDTTPMAETAIAEEIIYVHGTTSEEEDDSIQEKVEAKNTSSEKDDDDQEEESDHMDTTSTAARSIPKVVITVEHPPSEEEDDDRMDTTPMVPPPTLEFKATKKSMGRGGGRKTTTKEATRIEAGKQDARTKEASKKAASTIEASKQEESKKEARKKEASKTETSKKEASQKEGLPPRDPKRNSNTTAKPQESVQPTRPVPQRTEQFRYDVKVHIPACGPGQQMPTLCTAIEAFINMLKTQDEKLVVYPWAEGSKDETLEEAEDLPTQMTGLLKYCPRAYAAMKERDLYFSMYLGHELSFAELHTNINHVLSDTRSGWYRKQLQCQDAEVIGWLLYTTNDMDLVELMRKLLTRYGVTVGLRWRAIAPYTPTGKISAVHIEVNKKTANRDRAILKQIYSSTATSFPLSIKARLVPTLDQARGMDSGNKIARLRTRQAVFLHNVSRQQDYSIATLDYEDKQLEGKTLRDLLMEMKVKDKPTTPLFVSVDKHWASKGFVFQMTTTNEEEASQRIRSLLPYLIGTMESKYHVQIRKMFSLEALQSEQTCKWDTEKQMVIWEDDALLDDLLGGSDKDYDFPDTDASQFKVDMSIITDEPKGTSEPQMAASTGDSVSTFATKKTASSAKKKATVEFAIATPTIQKKAVRHKSDATVNSSVTLDSLESRMSTMEKSTAKSLDELKQLIHLLVGDKLKHAGDANASASAPL